MEKGIQLSKKHCARLNKQCNYKVQEVELAPQMIIIYYAINTIYFSLLI